MATGATGRPFRAGGSADTGSAAADPAQILYPSGAYRRLMSLVQAGLLDISPIRPVTFPLSGLPAAAKAAAHASSLECVVVGDLAISSSR